MIISKRSELGPSLIDHRQQRTVFMPSLRNSLPAMGCGFNWSAQHNGCLCRKEHWHEAKTAELLHRSSEGPDVGVVAEIAVS